MTQHVALALPRGPRFSRQPARLGSPVPQTRHSIPAPHFATPANPIDPVVSEQSESESEVAETASFHDRAKPNPIDPIAVAREVDAICEAFETDWQDGHNPQIEAHLPNRDNPAFSQALRELIALERELLEGQGNAVDWSRYLSRFPDDSDDLKAFFSMENQASAAAKAHSPSSAQHRKMLAGHPRIGHYELLDEIGRGGMGVVYRARHTVVGRVVALKMILSGDFASASEMVRFRAEAEAAANLDHPHIVTVLEFGEQAGLPFYTMRLFEGGSLASRKRKASLNHRAAARLLATVARAMHHAHRKGLIHRDLKPANILFDEAGHPHVTDFGLAKRLGSEGPTGTGVPIGTPSYMAPEQAAGRTDLTSSADIYSLVRSSTNCSQASRRFVANLIWKHLCK
jgi:serine/threonine-protein kinase